MSFNYLLLRKFAEINLKTSHLCLKDKRQCFENLVANFTKELYININPYLEFGSFISFMEDFTINKASAIIVIVVKNCKYFKF